MNVITVLLLIAAAAAPLAVLGAWHATRRDARAATLVHVGGTDDWWRQAMPWPRGVQEDDDVHWNFGGSEPGGDPAADAVTLDLVRVRAGAPVTRRGR